MALLRDFLKPPAHIPRLPQRDIDNTYKRMRWQMMIGIFIGYAGYYLIRKNFSLAMPNLIALGYTKAQLGFALSGVSLAYGLSKFLMGNVSDRSDARKFIVLGLSISSLVTIFMGTADIATSSITSMFVLLCLSGWFQGIGYPSCVRVMAHWFTIRERGVKMAIWNTAHNVGAGLVGPLAILAVFLFHDWQSKIFLHGYVALAFALVTWFLVRDTPQSCGLPSVEEWTGEYHKSYSEDHEREMTAREIFFEHVFNNKLLWYLAFANIFVYLVRYGVLDWAPTYLEEAKNFSMSQTGWAYFAYEFAGIPGILITGWLSDKVFYGRRAPINIIFMLLVAVAVFIYWQNPAGNPAIDIACLIVVGFLIYGPVVLIGVQALDMAPKKAAGTATGLTGLFGYLGGAMFANIAMGFIVDSFDWSGGFIVLIASCIMAALLVALTLKEEKTEKAELYGHDVPE
ncbi:glycerol-3-phosphate transporter [Parendozoicomonas haliclonae]|uniref:Glycerol-3-phosphate transporter n=1 Tax=Parendozoicomonas haliclonae TaxID=1960125 RepID=A0A1X7AEB5_9GAMM|nr:glycerol-3-phosphate transporter [Parendozoicomonas haliclonae]SMA33953.1 Glycerol-3-phosphate transporter [Parendozoicomonas haliclonae]